MLNHSERTEIVLSVLALTVENKKSQDFLASSSGSQVEQKLFFFFTKQFHLDMVLLSIMG